ncbi:transmembrane protein 151 homolog [Paramacrobiotus metropolitanus]|uniref:transmembrane protein 151 homolog n=1 Tax=Paramacrobiotus metropolitanus TaxID=2943436 RepID=UPI002445ACA3|nr:transmembrane protein 151 homolog [Paramacrobiotus metropolitanus]
MDTKISGFATPSAPPFEGSPLPPPSYEEVMQSIKASQQAATFPEAGASSHSACSEMFSAGSTYARMFLLLAIVAGIVLLVIGGVASVTWGLVAGGVLFGLGYFIYLLDVFCWGSNYKFLSNPNEAANIHYHVDAVRAAPPAIVWIMECYHMETRTRTVEEGSGDDRRTRTETYEEKCVTWRGHQAFEYTHWADVSAPHQLERLQAADHTRVRFRKHYELADEATISAYAMQKQYFVDANKYRDCSYDLSEAFMVPGFVPAVLASQPGRERPFFLRLSWYLLAVVVLLELPFSFMIKKHSALMEYVYVKRLTCAPHCC